jgi:hypothetical protein
MPLDSTQHHPLMCLTQDDPAMSHLEQAVCLLIAGARWIQVRMKRADAGERLHVACIWAGRMATGARPARSWGAR